MTPWRPSRHLGFPTTPRQSVTFLDRPSRTGTRPGTVYPDLGYDLPVTYPHPGGCEDHNIWFHSAGAGSTITHMWAGLLDKTLTPRCSWQTLLTPSHRSRTVAASTPISYTLTTPFTTTYSGFYYLLLVITASTQPTWNCAPLRPPLVGLVMRRSSVARDKTTVTTVASYNTSIVPSAYVAPLLGYMN